MDDRPRPGLESFAVRVGGVSEAMSLHRPAQILVSPIEQLAAMPSSAPTNEHHITRLLDRRRDLRPAFLVPKRRLGFRQVTQYSMRIAMAGIRIDTLAKAADRPDHQDRPVNRGNQGCAGAPH